MGGGGRNKGAERAAREQQEQDRQRNIQNRQDAAYKDQGAASKENSMRQREKIAEQVSEQQSKRPETVDVELSNPESLEDDGQGNLATRRSKFHFLERKGSSGSVRT